MSRQLAEVTSRVQIYEGLLRTLHPKLDTTSAELIEQALTNVTPKGPLNPWPMLTKTVSPNTPKALELTYRSVFSLGAFDYTEEDLNYDLTLQSMGFIGQPSEIAWLYRLKRQLD